MCKTFNLNFVGRNRARGYADSWVLMSKRRTHINTFENLIKIDTPMQGTKESLFNLILLYKCKVFDIRLDDKINPLVTDNHEIEFRDESKIIALSLFWTIRVLMQVTKTTFLSEMFVSSSKLSIEILMDEIQPVKMDSLKDWGKKSLKTNYTSFVLPVYKDSNARYKTKDFSVEQSWRGSRLSMET